MTERAEHNKEVQEAIEKKEREEAKRKAKEAAEYRSKKSSDAIYYWMVLGGFALMCIACIFYIFHEWRESPNLIPAISPKDIEKHNSAKGVSFQRGPNTLFQVLQAAK